MYYNADMLLYIIYTLYIYVYVEYMYSTHIYIYIMYYITTSRKILPPGSTRQGRASWPASKGMGISIH